MTNSRRYGAIGLLEGLSAAQLSQVSSTELSPASPAQLSPAQPPQLSSEKTRCTIFALHTFLFNSIVNTNTQLSHS